MAGLSKQERQRIVEEFTTRHNGHFNPQLFVEEVRTAGPEHPAYNWFEWDKDKAANAHWVEQARQFARDLRVTYKVEEVRPERKHKVVQREMPLVLSPIEGRRHGGGYFLTNPDDPDHMKEHCKQAAIALRSWLDRYGSALEYAGRRRAEVERLLTTLENAKTLVPETA